MHEYGSHTAAAAPGSSPLIGRDDAVDLVIQLVRRPDVRLVTVTGRSGVGKSVLAATVARTIEVEEGVGVARAQVDRHTSRAGADELSAALSIPTEGPAGPAPAGRRRLVLLDGLEAVSGSSELVAAALAADHGLTVLATSVIPLVLPGEQLVRLEPLSLPGSEDADLDAQCAAPAVQLLRTRIVEAAGQDVEPDPAATVALARLLDGLPLALELAAARCAELPVAEVLEQVERLGPIDVLAPVGEAERGAAVDGAADEPHHRSLRATILWSYGLLDDDHRRTLRRLGVFAGSFGPSAVGAVTGGSVDHLGRLVTAGLARPAERGPIGERFELVPSVSLVARELLADDADLGATEDRHATHYLAVAATAAPALRSPATPDVRRELLSELDDILAAVRHLDRRGRRDDGLRLMVDLALMWEESSASARAAQLLGELLSDLSSAPTADPCLTAEAWALAAMVALWGQGTAQRVADLPEELARSGSVLRSAGSTGSLLMVLRSQVASHLLAGDPEGATGAAEEGLALARVQEDAWWTCQFLGWSAAALTMAGASATALALGVEGRDLALLEGDTAQLLRISHILVGIGGLEVDGDAGDAPMSEQDLIVLARRVDDAHAEGVLHVGGAVRAAVSGDVVGAAGHLRAALDLGRRHGLWYIEELALLGTVVVATVGGRAEDAARIHGGLADVLPGIERAVAPASMELYRYTIDQVRSALGDAEFHRAVARGRLLDWEEATGLGAVVCDELWVVPAPAPSATLSPRQAEVLALLALGRTNKEIATDLGMRSKTVMHHTSEIYRRLGVRNRTEAVSEAHRLGLVGA